jgi:2'-5' RNA ligase
MAVSAFVVTVPEAEACVGPLRERFDASAKLGVPAHITVLVPFMSPERISAAVLEQAQRALTEVHAFSFQLFGVKRFAATAYLAPEPAAPFSALTQSLVRRFPDFPAYSGEFASVVPHLTVAHGSAAEAEVAAAELEAKMQSYGPVRSSCSSVVLLENSSGLWRPMHAFALLPAPGDG